MTHLRARAFLDSYDIDATDVDFSDDPEVGDHRVVVVNFVDKTWVLDFAHLTDHDFVDVRVFDDTPDVEKWHAHTAGATTHPEGLSTPIGMFGMTMGRRPTFGTAGIEPSNHGWPAATTIVLLADHPEKAA